jgi:hypothetical protein
MRLLCKGSGHEGNTEKEITVTSSLNVTTKISVTPPASTPVYKQVSEQILKDDVNGFSSILDICFMEVGGVRVGIMRL